MKYRIPAVVFTLTLTGGALLPCSAVAEPQSSPRMEKAKDYIAEEHWTRAIDVLRAASADPKERSRDEALFWLAHSLHQARDLAGAVEIIAQLERNFPASRWVKPARSLRVELAQKLRREDVLWWAATAPPPPPPAPYAVHPAAPVHGARPPALPDATMSPLPVPPPRSRPGVMPPAPPPAPAPRPGRVPPTPPPPPPSIWVSEFSASDPDLRIQALGSLMRTDAPRVIPMLREIALDGGNPREASRAVFVLAQSGRPDAHMTVLEVAKRATEPVSVAAIRELGRFGGPKVSDELLQVYGIGNNPRVKYQVVNSLGERAATGALLQIVQSESDRALRDTAIVTLGQAGGRTQLQRLYVRGRPEWKRPIIVGLFNARAEDELIQIAEREPDDEIRREVLMRLRLLGTPKAKAYLQKAQVSR